MNTFAEFHFSLVRRGVDTKSDGTNSDFVAISRVFRAFFLDTKKQKLSVTVFYR